MAVKSSRHYKAQFQMQTQENENKKPLKMKKGKNENWALKVEFIVLGFAQYKQRVY